MATSTLTQAQTLDSGNLFAVQSASEFRDLLSKDLNRVSLLNFWAPWAEPCKQMNEVVNAIAQRYPELLVVQIEAETQEDIAETFEINSVPTCILLRGHTLLSRVDGADAARLAKEVDSIALKVKGGEAKTDRAPVPASNFVAGETEEQLNQRLLQLMNQSHVVLFMKGSPDVPRCGFSRTIVGLLRDRNVEFTHFDILSDENVRSGLKKLNNWPTFPQLIVGGEFVGGLDIVKEMIASGEFDEVVQG